MRQITPLSNKWVRAGFLYSGALFWVCGCGAKQTQSDADLKKAFSQKTFSISDVPAEQRERVRAIMESQKAMKK